jgi:DNA-binding protein Fis
MTTSIGFLGTVPEAIRAGLRERGHEVHDGIDDVIVAFAAKGGALPAFPKESVVVAICDGLEGAATAYRAGAHFVAPTDVALVSELAERARKVFANQKAVEGFHSSTLATLEKEAILFAMKAAAGSTARAAAMLDISVRKVQYKLHEYGVPLTRRSSAPPAANGVKKDAD